MAAKDSKIHVAGSIIDDDDPTLDSGETNDPLKGVLHSLVRNKRDIIKQKAASLAMQTQLNGMTGQLEQILLALSSLPVANQSVTNDDDYDPSAEDDDNNKDTNTHDR